MNSLLNRIKKIEEAIKGDEQALLVIHDKRNNELLINGEVIQGDVESELNKRNINPASSKVILIEISDFNK
jgi:C4-type Zn-finger protein